MFPQRDSNSGPLDHKTDALPTELILQEIFGQKNSEFWMYSKIFGTKVKNLIFLKGPPIKFFKIGQNEIRESYTNGWKTIFACALQFELPQYCEGNCGHVGKIKMCLREWEIAQILDHFYIFHSHLNVCSMWIRVWKESFCKQFQPPQDRYPNGG